MTTDKPLYPLGLPLDGRDVLVVGGGPVAARRASTLALAGAIVSVVAPEGSEDLADLVRSGAITWRRREYRTGDLDRTWLVYAATGIPEVDGRVAADALALRVWCVDVAEQEDDGSARRDPDATHGDFSPGSVALVGGGPGHPELITVRGRRLLGQADVVIADRLGPRALLAELASDTLVIDVGKMPGHHPVPQQEINALIVRHALDGKRVVRLKGGDPYVFGRGGEEAEFCRAAGVAVLVVPGVTSAVSVPASAGIPVTHRGVATGFTVVTGHDQIAAVPGGRDHTVVLLMGVSGLAWSAATLAAGARGEACPVAVIEDGFGSGERVTIGTLGTIAAQGAERGIRSPAVVVVGDVVSLSPHAHQDSALTGAFAGPRKAQQ